MFVQSEDTPNPNALKFLLEKHVSDQPIHFNNIEETKGKSILAYKIFNINHVKAVFFGSDFITITKESEIEWNLLKTEILMTIMNHFVSGLTALDNPKERILDENLINGSEIEKQIIEIIETRVRPSVAMDGGDIIYKGFKDGIVKLELRGSCSGCPSSTITLKNGIESMLKHFIPEVEAVEAEEEG